MSRFRRPYLYSHDLDWFLNVSGYWCHMASLNGDLPDKANDVSMLPILQSIIYHIYPIFPDEAIEYNNEFLETRYGRQQAIIEALGRDFQYLQIPFQDFKDRYVESFGEMAKKGFISLTRVVEEKDNEYRWVARPKDMTFAADLDEKISNEINRLGIKGQDEFDEYVKGLDIHKQYLDIAQLEAEIREYCENHPSEYQKPWEDFD